MKIKVMDFAQKSSAQYNATSIKSNTCCTIPALQVSRNFGLWYSEMDKPIEIEYKPFDLF